ncbi:alpha/beta fold hydrolase [Saccharolobus caldissimus]|uniref:2-hydroxy-6-oxo-6-phenylhexa-2,4-dienoate hydrolase n=1 Tax=Saccharolobus caldissimus TaxID=1702097 RepID=A0AAQ4CT68_9CREN|nr:alpha/beta hydrolase [Saccharolobus caldissimus]BDB98999.1 2-hydroxy-6-oxo-6-phenylhexa-2,4-dienoate hydrolase [Saccharolobus caldissimus]
MQQLQDKFVDVNGLKIHYIEYGDGKPVLLFHGARFNARTWEQTGTISAIASTSYKAISVDFPGFGKSEGSKSEDLSEFIYSFMNTMKIDKAILLGASMGGEAVLGFSVKYTNLVSGLILVGAVGVKRYSNLLYKLTGIPILLIWGANDNVSPKENYELILNKLKDAKLEIVGSQHACYLDDPVTFNQKIVEFLKGLR